MSTDPALLWNSPRPPARKPRPAEPLWSVRKAGRQIDAELLGQGEYGWEFRLLDRGEFYAGRRFDLRAQAVAHGEEIRRELEADGWSAPDTRPIGGH